MNELFQSNLPRNDLKIFYVKCHFCGILKNNLQIEQWFNLAKTMFFKIIF